MAEIVPNKVPCGRKPAPTPKPEPTPAVTLCDLTGVKYFKLQSDIPGDYTKNCGLLGNEIDENFYFLRSMDIKTAYTIDEDNRKILVLERVNCHPDIMVDITDDDAYQFRLEDGYIIITFPDGHEEQIGKFLVEGDNVHIVTDSSIQGDGSYGNPIGVDLAYRTGTLEPADFFADLTCEDATLESISGIGYGHAVVTKENVSRFGALYTWDQAMKINEALEREGRGWRLPTSEDWGKLLNWAEGDCEDCKNHITERSGNFGCVAGYRLKSKEYWYTNEDSHEPVDDFGFAVYPVGICPENYNTKEPQKFGYTGLYKVTSFWTSTICDRDGEPYARTFSYGHDGVAQFTENKKRRLSIRLVKDIGDNFDVKEFEEILGEYVPVTLTTDGKQIWTNFNIGLLNYEGYDEREVTIPEEWQDVATDMEAKQLYKLDESGETYVLSDESELPSYIDEEDIEVYDEIPEVTTASSEFIYVTYMIHLDMVSEAKFYYNAWDGNRWHKRLLHEGESVVLLYEDWPSPCVTGSTGDTYVSEEKNNKNHEWRIYVNEKTGLDELIDTLEALKGEFGKEFKEIKELISGLTENLNTLSGFVGDMYNEMQSGFSSAFTEIQNLQDELDVVEASVGLSGDGTFIVIRESGLTACATTIAEAIGILDDTILEDEEITAAALNDLNERMVEVSGSVKTIQDEMGDMGDEIDAIEEAVGLTSAGTYVMKSGTTYLDEAESVEEEIAILDEVVASAMTEIEELQKKTIEPLDESIIVEVSGYTTYIGVQIDKNDKHLVIGNGTDMDGDGETETGLWFNGEFKLDEEDDEDIYGYNW